MLIKMYSALFLSKLLSMLTFYNYTETPLIFSVIVKNICIKYLQASLIATAMATVAPTNKFFLIKKEVFFTLPKHFLFSFFYLNKYRNIRLV